MVQRVWARLRAHAYKLFASLESDKSSGDFARVPTLQKGVASHASLPHSKGGTQAHIPSDTGSV